MLIVEGTYENGEVHLDTPVAYQQPVRVRVQFMDEHKLTVRPQFSFDEALALTVNTSHVQVSDAVIEEREENEW